MTTKIVTRSGEISSLVNLGVVSAETCRSVVILSSAPPGPTKEDLEHSDMRIIKTILGVKSVLTDAEVPVVAEIFDADRRDLAYSVDPDRVAAIDAEDMLAKILVQTSRNEGLAVVYEEMLSFDGAEIYLYEPEVDVTGKRFDEVSYLLADGVLLGLMRADGTLELNPGAEEAIYQGDELVILASDDSAISISSSPVVSPMVHPRSMVAAIPRWERELIIGWTAKLPTIVSEYGDYVIEGSEIDIVLREPDETRAAELVELAASVPSLRLRLLEKNPRQAEDLLDLRPFEYDNIIVLSEAGQAGAAEWADSETLVYLLQLQAIFRSQEANGNGSKTKLIAEVLESRNRELIAETGVRDFVISNRFVSMVMAQISEEKTMGQVYDDLFGEAGSEVYLKPPTFYFGDMPSSVTFGDIMAACYQRDEVAIGIRRRTNEHDPKQNFGVELIPDKGTAIEAADLLSIVVLAEDEA